MEGFPEYTHTHTHTHTHVSIVDSRFCRSKDSKKESDRKYGQKEIRTQEWWPVIPAFGSLS
jgi:hypothetical protein